jgi:hypothetical protein
VVVAQGRPCKQGRVQRDYDDMARVVDGSGRTHEFVHAVRIVGSNNHSCFACSLGHGRLFLQKCAELNTHAAFFGLGAQAKVGGSVVCNEARSSRTSDTLKDETQLFTLTGTEIKSSPTPGHLLGKK